MSIEAIIFYLLLIDSIGANLVSWTKGRKWYREHLRIFSKWFPATRGWSTYYLILVLLMGYLLHRQGVALF